ncbi:PilC/PilY family type IV pilus protein [Sansalvadorimonas sp. 2012CJ34-2]|uniref:PilC/PilY family type IV pilus protein n=1 Tax=Parendozoicomonas callyspongiae TaxID=2942213 RepID=A0ABT0PDP5_9GAMM|nr:PilC/PilY family type IV pilus protein [Sansalvadorimonas sp. 2012CJ34-2]MCL6269487.1 PilC/PilY family type IV pilus protein [Sansalvadorimonas sp. 2012CJ34-2]
MKLSKHLSILFTFCFGVYAKALDFVNTPLFLLNASVPNIVMMLDDSGSMDVDLLNLRHYDSCAYQYVFAPSFTSNEITSDPGGDYKVCFYDNENYTGTKNCFIESDAWTGGAPTYRHDVWSSVRLKPGYGVRVYRGGSYTDTTTDFSTDQVRLTNGFDNSISSFKIFKTNEPSQSCGNLRTNGYIYPNGSWQRYFYIYSHDNAYWATALSSDFSIRDTKYFYDEWGDWRLFSSDMNVMYYDPSMNYQPWRASDPNASFTAARAHGLSGGAGYNSILDLTGSFYAVAVDDKGFTDVSGGPVRNADSFDTSGNGMIDIWDSHTLYQINSSAVTRTEVSYEVFDDDLGRNVVRRENRLPDITDSSKVAEIQQNYANWYQYSRRRSFVMSGAISQLVQSFPNYRYSYGVINNTSMLMNAPENNSDIPAHNDSLLADLFLRNRGLGSTPLAKGLNTVGSYLKKTGSDAPIIEECQQNFSILFTDGYWTGSLYNSSIGNEDGDPYSQTVADVAHYYYSNDLRPDLDDKVPISPVDPAVHQHLVTFPVAFGVDGSLNDTDNDGWPDVSGVQLKESDDWGNPYYWGSPNKINDLWHAAFNSKGLFSSARTPQELVDGLKNALAGANERISSASSVATNTGSLRGNSHVYQARFNSAGWTGDLIAHPLGPDGSILNPPSWQAASLLDVRAANNRVIITSDKNASNNLVGVPFRHAGSNTLSSSYVDRLKDGRSLLAIQGDVDDYVEALVDYLRGDAANESDAVLTDWKSCASEGDVCTVTGTTTVRYGISGNYNSKEVAGSVNCSDDEFGDSSVGNVKACEYAETRQYGFRSRSSKFGDLAHSDPVYVGPPTASYLDPEYLTFRSNWLSRAEMVYIGGNDGMLHGFDAETGVEKLAYVPFEMAKSIYKLADSGYAHDFFVDGQISIGDACVGNPSCSWKTMLAGSLRTGGRAVYALDVTDPASFSESKASNLFMWEFGSDDDADMGYFFGQPLIVKLSTGKWGVIISNGYNSDDGKAVLFILDAETGQPLAVGGKLDTQMGTAGDPNGLSSPTAVDTDSDGDVDLVYAGDLKGNLWKFDVSSSDPSNWGVGYSSGGSPIPLFAAGSTRPITVAPAVGRHPEESGYMIYFGTGKYIEITDNGNEGQATQSFYGIWDDTRDNSSFNASITSSELLQQTILQEVKLYPQDTNGDGLRNTSDSGFTFRLTSSNSICWRNCNGGAVPHRGWRFDMVYLSDNRGEKQVSDSILRNGRIIFTTLQPSLSSCDRGGRSWLMELNAADGSFLNEPPFDLNQDGEFDGSDVDYGAWGMVDPSVYCPSGNCQAPGGILIDEIVQTPSIMDCAPGVECKYISGSEGGIDKIDENVGSSSLGRQSWRELRGE